MNPRLARIGWPAVVMLAGVSAALDASVALFPVDFGILGRAADTLLSARWEAAFESPGVQVGPLYLLVLGLLRSLARSLEVDPRIVFSIVAQTGVVVATMGCVRAVVGERSLLELIAGVTATVGGVAWTAYISGHPEEIMIGFLWLGAALAARRNRAFAAGLLIALACVLKLTGVLGVALLILLPGVRARLMGVSTVIAGLVLAYLPFFLAGEVNTFEFDWPVGSVIARFVLGDASRFPWWMRVAQGTLTISLGALVTHRARTTAHVVWAGPLAIATIRVLLDPLPHHYLWLSFEGLVIVGGAALALHANARERLALGAVVYAGIVGRYLAPLLVMASRTGIAFGLVAWALRREAKTGLDPAPAGRPGPGREEAIAGTRFPG